MRYLLLLPVLALAQSPSVQLNWNAVTAYTDGSAITGTVTYSAYEVGTPNTLIGEGLTGTNWTYSGSFEPGKTYCFVVTATVGGVEGAVSNQACKSFAAAPKVPSAPTGLTAQ